MAPEKEILNAKKWVGETTRSALYGVSFLVAGAVGIILVHEHDFPTAGQACIGGIAGIVGLGMMTESNFFAARKHLQDLQSRSKEIK